MHVGGPIPISSHVARAYGMQRPATPSTRLVAGTVSVAPNHDAAPAPTTQRVAEAAAMAMYTRAADRVEAATGVALGRVIDARA